MSGALLAAACCAQISAAAAPSRAAPPNSTEAPSSGTAAPPSRTDAPRPLKVLEVALRLGPTYITGAALPNATSDRRAGMEAALQLFYRTRYFLTPYLEGGYGFLSTGSAFIPQGQPGGPGTIADRLDAWHITSGISFEVQRFRAGAAVGYSSFGLSTRFAGVASSTAASSLGLDGYLGLTLVRAPRFFATFDLVTHNAPTADLHYFQAAFAIHGDFLRW